MTTPIIDWFGLYGESWGDTLCPAAYKHPAKLARGLITQIYRHGFEQGWWQKGSTVADPFAGVACGGIVAAYQGLRWVGVELEERFVAAGNESLERHRRVWETIGDPVPVLLQGDSRNFASLLHCSAIVTSPPYAGSSAIIGGGVRIDYSKCKEGGRKRTTARVSIGNEYGESPGQIGALPSGSLDAVLTSPPYQNQVIRPGGRTTERPEDTANPHGSMASGEHAFDAYGDSAGQIASLPIGSVNAVVTSPPYEDAKGSPALGGCERAGWGQGGDIAARQGLSGRYGTADGQIGAAAGETYWGAVRQVYSSCLEALRPGGVLCCVVKDYLRRKARVPLCDQTMTLLLSLGFLPVCRIRAWMVEETRQPGLFGTDMVKRIERKSFFRRLIEKKNPALAIDFEEVLVVRRPLEVSAHA